MGSVNSFKGHAVLLLASCRRWNNGFITAAILIRAYSLHEPHASFLQRPPTTREGTASELIIHSSPEVVNSNECFQSPDPSYRFLLHLLRSISLSLPKSALPLTSPFPFPQFPPRLPDSAGRRVQERVVSVVERRNIDFLIFTSAS